MVPEHLHEMVLCSDTRYPVWKYVHYCEIVGKALGNQRKTCSHKDPALSLVPEYKVSTLYSGTGTEPEFWRLVLRKRCVRIGAQLRIVSGQRARVPSVNTALNSKDPRQNSCAVPVPEDTLYSDTKLGTGSFLAHILRWFPGTLPTRMCSVYWMWTCLQFRYQESEHNTICARARAPSVRAPSVNTGILSNSFAW